MKDLITAVASIMLLMVFLLQFSAGQVLHHRMFLADMSVETFRDMAKAEGCISSGNAVRLEEELGRILGCEEEEITVTGGTGPSGTGSTVVTEGGLIYYRITYPLANLVAAAEFLGISQEENRAWMEEEGWVVSRVEEPDNNGSDGDTDDSGDSVSDGLQQPGGQPEEGEVGL